MRLIHSRTLEFEVFNEDSLPPYVILSHTWGSEEISYQDMCFIQKLNATPPEIKQHSLFGIVSSLVTLYNAAAGNVTETSIKHKAGYKKIVQTAAIAHAKGYQYFWCDTVAIDKTSSAELQEAINSMYRWYQEAALCVVYLDDAAPYEDLQEEYGRLLYCLFVLKKSRWVTRGWTLQELIAPRVLELYDKAWTCVGNKREMLYVIETITSIPADVLATGVASQYSVAQKMSWAANRRTSRIEDMAYSLMGLFDVHMPMLYGEGEHAFIRLQEEIMKTTADSSIFAWRAAEGGASTFRGLLARAPSEFKDAGNIVGTTLLTSNTNMGLRLELKLISSLFSPSQENVAVELGARKDSVPITLFLKELSRDEHGTHYCRVNPQSFGPWPPANHEVRSEVIHVRQVPVVHQDYKTAVMHCFHFRRADSLLPSPEYFISSVWPPQCWNERQQQLIIPEAQENFIGMVRFEPTVGSPLWLATPFQIILGFERSTHRTWCKLDMEGEPILPHVVQNSGSWMDTLKVQHPLGVTNVVHRIDLDPPKPGYLQSHKIRVSIHAGLFRDNVSLIVNIAGLQVR